MYTFRAVTKKVKRKLFYIKKSSRVRTRLQLVRVDPRRNSGAHKLKGKLSGAWSCVLAADVRMVYEIDDEEHVIYVLKIGSHKIYR